ncbi:serine/threonine-protein kinase mTOR isoform X1 [Hypanus sabinus]|uniref:serine/threonine-protein kinase mTOR isoform X1 n=1 Tax=Hypanus sabinus TaxID=79690 RepID=UPI0028C41505|nr:serine/threonine-protein kinase mTOR isoform X1 [Hypanus sabinus]XP_059807692.1 serine/threonine-protein kinase mTOR isoform X1 [Hypanus sabinus]
MSGTASVLQQFVNGLKSRSEETRAKAAKDLQHYVTTELREVNQEEVTSFYDELNHHIFELVSSSDVNERKGGILAIVSLIGVEGGNATRITRFANYLRNLLPSSDTVVMEMASKAVGRLSMAGDTFTAEYVEFEVKRALEWLGADRNEGRRHAAVLILRELAVSAPTFFFQQVQAFFDNIFYAVWDSKQAIREGAVAALRACLILTTQRETKEMQRPQWYKQTFDEAEKGFDETLAKEKGLNRDDRIHGALLILNELIRISSMEGERLREEMEDITQQQLVHDKYCKELMGFGAKPRHITSFTSFQSAQPQQSNALLGLLGYNTPQSISVFGATPAPAKPTLVESRYCREHMEARIEQVIHWVLKYRSSKNPLIQMAILNLIPRLAAFKPLLFTGERKGMETSEQHLYESMNHLLACLKREKERAAAFQALGLLVVAVKTDLDPYMPRILDILKAALPPKDFAHKRQKPVQVDATVFTCICMLARAIGPTIQQDIKELLEQMLAVGLSPALTAVLHDLCRHIPALKKDIQDGLLKMLSLVLMHKPLRHPGMPKSLAQQLASPSLMNIPEANDVGCITLALRTLGTFEFEGHSLTQFVRHCADHFLNSEHKEIRMEAARTCSRLLTPSVHLISGHGHVVSQTAVQVVADVLSKLLVVGITDPDPDIRYCVLASLDERFDAHLAQAENLQALFVALNDEVFEIRELAICTIGRLSSMNPAFVMPFLRKMLIQILTELEHSGVGRNKEQSARMLGHLVSNAPRLIRPYMEPILKALILKLKDHDPNPGVIVSVLATIGELAQVSGLEMRKWMDELFPIIMDMLQDSSSLAKRQVALWTLGQQVACTGYVVEPYRKYPSLLEVLLNFLKTEQNQGIRREAIRVLGLLGALDPYKHKVNIGMIDQSRDASAVSLSESKSSQDSADYSTSEMLVNMGNLPLDEFYPAVAIVTLMRILRDTSLSNHHTMVVQAVTFIFKSLGLKCVQFLPQVMPTFLNVIRVCDANTREFLFQQLGMLVSFVKIHIRPYMDDIFALIKEYWTLNNQMQNTIILVIEQIVVALGGEFKLYLPQLIPHMLRVFMHDTSTGRSVTIKLLNAIQLFGANLDDYLHLLLPPIVKLFDGQEVPLTPRKVALETLDRLTESLDFTDYASRIIHPIVRTLDCTPELRQTAMDTLSSLVFQLGKKYQIFIPMVNKMMMRHRINHQRYDVLVCRIVKGYTLAEEEEEDDQRRSSRGNQGDRLSSGPVETQPMKKLHVSTTNLQKAWGAARRVSKDDWMEWLRRLSVELLKESPSPALRSCWSLAQAYNPLARDLFNAAFLSCWSELHESQQDELIRSIELALTSQDIPEVTQTLLNLAEFMEHSDKGPLPLRDDNGIVLLGERAAKCRAYAKALHYKELEFQKGPCPAILESLISDTFSYLFPSGGTWRRQLWSGGIQMYTSAKLINNKLQQPEAAAGVLEYAMKHYGELEIQATWYEKLHEWEDALVAYDKKMDMNKDDPELALGRMRCLEALGEWGQLHQQCCEKWTIVSEDIKAKMARMAAAAAWGLGHWDSMEEYACMIPRDTHDGAFYRAVLALHQDLFSLAQQCIDRARDLLDTELTAMAGESYSRAYGAMVSCQMLSELEEVIQYKLVPERRDIIRQTWWERLQGCQQIVEDWQRILMVRSLVIGPHEDMRTWLKYASLCGKNGRLALAHKTLVQLLGVDPSKHLDQPLSTVHPHVTYSYMKYMWKSTRKIEAFQHMQHFVQNVQQQAQHAIAAEDQQHKQELHKLMARCFLKLGEWQLNLQGINESTIPKVLQYYSAATEHDRSWYKAWHAWAVMNFEAVLHYKHQNQTRDEKKKLRHASGTSATSEASNSESEGDSNENSPMPSPLQKKVNEELSKTLLLYTVPAVQGFFRSIALSRGNNLQDTLRVLTLWFDYGHWPDVNEALVEGIKTIQIDTWLQVIPQLIARIDTPRALVGRLIHQLLTDIGRYHPQALIYPLTVASKSTTPARHSAANKILKNMCEHSNTLVQQAMMVSEELIRVAILWHEMWHEGLEEASRLYFGERNVKGMFAVLEPLHAMMERGPQTLKETSFNQAYGRDLMEAQEWCRKYMRSGNVKDLTQAWDLYYHVFRRISKQLPQLTSLELQYVSPKLLMCRDLELAVPGTYDPNQPIIRIQSIAPSLQVITSKQRPRKLTIMGSNGHEFMFLLKGHEDLRQDERVMQLFGLVNTLLANDPASLRKNLSIQRYAVIPLSTNSGLIGWVPHCDTLHALIRDYREKKKILLNIEHRIMLRMAPDYDHLTLMQKVEVFEHAVNNTAGDDLAKLLWLKSPSSEVWFDRRTNYTRSLAVMSMVGYILGLGDRHPSNLMLDRLSGKILHIDFGDCFEVAMTREKFPEKIPFRLTRMLTNAMEVTGLDGNYRITCHTVMEVLREHRDSVMAVLEAFVYDPLLNWRLMDTNVKGNKRSRTRTDSYSTSQTGELLDGVELGETTHKKTGTTVPESIHSFIGDGLVQPEALNKKAIQIINRVRDKLTGRDFAHDETLDVPTQVELLIKQATSHENLCQCYIGWCPFW